MYAKKMEKEMTPYSKDLDALKREYSLIVPLAKRFSEELVHQINRLLEQEKIYLSIPIQCRVKGWDSIAEKLERKTIKINSIKDINDLVGLRLILQFRRDVNTVTSIINKTFKVIEFQDAQERLKEDQFGYSSMHLVIELFDSWLKCPDVCRHERIAC